MRILLGQLRANGDCMHATVLARQLRFDHPDASITWAVTPSALGVVRNNTDINDVWVTEPPHGLPIGQEWAWFRAEADRRINNGEFDFGVFSQIWPDNYQNFDGGVRSGILNAYGRPITVPVVNNLTIGEGGRERVENFIRMHRFKQAAPRVLFECSSRSGQSAMTPELAQEVGTLFLRKEPNAAIVFSTDRPMQLSDPRFLPGWELDFAETALLSESCSLFIGCGSGVSVATLMTGTKPITTLQVLAKSASVLGSVAHDLAFFQHVNSHITETTTSDPEALCSLMTELGASEALGREPVRIAVTFDHLFDPLTVLLLNRGRVLDAVRSIQLTSARYGWKKPLLRFARENVAPNVRLDPGYSTAEGRRNADAFLAQIASPLQSDDSVVQRSYAEALRIYNEYQY